MQRCMSDEELRMLNMQARTGCREDVIAYRRALSRTGRLCFTREDTERFLGAEECYRPLHAQGSGLADALEAAIAQFGNDEVLTMPELVHAKVQDVNKEKWFWKTQCDTLSEELSGVDQKGVWVSAGSGVVVVHHGRGLITPENIRNASRVRIIGSVQLEERLWSEFLEGKLSNGRTTELYHIDELRGGILPRKRNYGIILPFEKAQITLLGLLSRKDFIKNNLVLARIVYKENIPAYFNKAQQNYTVGNQHWHTTIPPQPEGRLLFLSDGYLGLYGNYCLSSNGRFATVVPKARGAPETNT